MYVALKSRDGYQQSLPLGVQLKPLRFSRSIYGGYEAAEVEVVGPAQAIAYLQQRLRYDMTIYNRFGSRCWNGFVNETVISTGLQRKSYSLDNLANRVAVTYSYEDETGGYGQAVTAWAENSLSVLRYGQKELIFAAGDQSEVTATVMRDTLLSELAWVRRSAGNDGSAGVKGSLVGLGWWKTLGWTYFANNQGLTSYDGSASTEQAVGWALTGTTISFTSPNKIADSGSRLGALAAGDKFVVSGSVANNVTFTVDTPGEAEVTVVESVTSGAAGPSVTLTAWGAEVAQSFLADGEWEVAMAGIWIKKIGSPTADVTVELMSGATPTTILDTATIAYTDVTQALRKRVGMFTNTTRYTPTIGNTYWIRVRKASGGTYDHANYYVVGLDPDAGYASGAFKVKSGSTWYDRPEGGDMPFAVLGLEDNAAMLRTIVGSSPLFVGSGAIIASNYNLLKTGVERNQYRDGSTLASSEADKLLAQHTDNGLQVLAMVDAQVRSVRFSSEPAPGLADYVLKRDKRLYYTNGMRVQPGVLPVGRWVRVENEMSTGQPDVEFLVAAEYDVERDEITPTWRGAVDPLAQLTGIENR